VVPGRYIGVAIAEIKGGWVRDGGATPEKSVLEAMEAPAVAMNVPYATRSFQAVAWGRGSLHGQPGAETQVPAPAISSL
jgi:hypothetical protein